MRWFALLALVSAAGCSESDTVSAIALRLDEAGILDEVDQLTLDVHDAAGLSCRTNGELEGTPTADPIVRDLRLTVGEEATVVVSQGERVFVVTGTAAGDRVASGCTAERLRAGQTVEIQIAVHRLLHPGECGNGDLEGGEECDDGNTSAGDGCDADCATEESTFPQGTDAPQIDPVAAAAPGGYFAVSWFDTNTAAGAFIKVAFRDLEGQKLAGGAGNDRDVNDQVRGDPNAPAVAVSDAGAVVAWEDYSGTGADVPDVKVHTFGANSVERHPDDVVAHPALDGRQEQPAVAMRSTGVSLVVWLDDQLAPPGVAGRIFDADGQPVGDATLTISGGQDASLVRAVATTDGFAVAYAGDGVHVRFVDEDGTIGDELATAAPASATAPAMGVTADGASLLVAWVQQGTVRGQIVRAGATVGDAFDISTTGTASQPAAAGGTGLFAVVWQAGGDVFGRLFDSDGTPIFNRVQDDATPFAVNRATDQNQVHPGVAILGDLLLAVWQDEGSRAGEDESPSGVRARWLSVAPPD